MGCELKSLTIFFFQKDPHVQQGDLVFHTQSTTSGLFKHSITGPTQVHSNYYWDHEWRFGRRHGRTLGLVRRCRAIDSSTPYVLQQNITDALNTKFFLVSSLIIRDYYFVTVTSVGLHESCKALRQESGIAGAGVPHRMMGMWAKQGQWALILRTLTTLDRARIRSLTTDIIAAVHEMAILEVADAGDLEVAYATFRFAQKDLEASRVAVSSSSSSSGGSKDGRISRSRNVEQKLAALAAARAKNPQAPVPKDFYGENTTRQEMRNAIADTLDEVIPEQPPGRLLALIQQAIKYQSYTGQLPRVKQWWPDDTDDNKDTKDNEPKKKKRRKVFDLVLGTSSHGETVVVGDRSAMGTTPMTESLPSNPIATVKFGKKAVCEASTFLPDGSLVTGSSDGLIEIWDASKNFSDLKLDLPYQQKDELLGHDQAVTALDASPDGTMLVSGDSSGEVRVWRIDTGKCLRTMLCHSAAISCIQFSPDASHVLTASQDGKCREFGLRTSKMLKEFTGHDSYVNFCHYFVHPTAGKRVITSSADGSVRMFDSSGDVVKLMRPSLTEEGGAAKTGVSIAVDASGTASAATTNPAIVALLPLHNPAHTMIIVPRCPFAFLVNMSGVILRVLESDSISSSFCAASTSASNKWLYAARDDGVLCIFDIQSGKMEGSVPDFGDETTRKSKDSKTAPEVSGIVSHPNRNLIGAFSTDKSQKRGQLVVWK